jgi:hypothetical protein
MKVKQNFWIARDEDGELHLFDVKPVLRKSVLYKSRFDLEDEGETMQINSGLFPNVTFSNSPQLVDLSTKTRKKKEYNLFIGKDSFGGIMVFKTLPKQRKTPGDFIATSTFNNGEGMREIPFAELASELDYGEVLTMKVIIG